MLLISCDKDRLDVDLSGKTIQSEVLRLDRDIFSPELRNSDSEISFLMNKYGEFFKIYASGILALGPVESPGFYLELERFRQDPEMISTYKDIQKIFPDLDELGNKFSDALSHYHYYFPDSTIPAIVTLHSGFNYAIVTAPEHIGVGLDLYLGRDYRYYPRLPNFPQFKIRKMTREHIVPDAIRSWITTTYFDETDAISVLDHIIMHGKILYLTEAMMPDTQDSLIVGFSQEGIEWARDFESRIWKFMIDQELLYSVKSNEVNKLISDGPFTPGLPRESPGGIGRWTGWQIVRNYMNRNPDVTLQELIGKPAPEILRASRYRP